MAVLRQTRIFKPGSKEPFDLSRSRLENFMRCRRCFYLDRRLGVDIPSSFPFNLNKAVDFLLKKEFDLHRAKSETHPLMKEYGIKAIPFSHPQLNDWRENFKGIRYHHQPTNLNIFGAVDDIWVNPDGQLHVVDYKATSKDGEVNLDADWQISYKRQLEIYQWLLRRNGFNVSDIGYFVYVNGRTDKEAFDSKLEFDVKIITHHGDDSWVETAIIEAHNCLMKEELPESSPDCEYCLYRREASKVELKKA